MLEKRQRIFATHTGTFTKTVDAPVRYVYDWCTDYRSDDGRLSKSKTRFRFVRVSPRRLVRVRFANTGAKDPKVAIELIRLVPPNAWHKDTIDEIDLDSIDYKLTALGPKKTRVKLVIVERWLVPKFPRKPVWLRSSSNYWDKLVLALEERYRSGRPAKG